MNKKIVGCVLFITLCMGIVSCAKNQDASKKASTSLPDVPVVQKSHAWYYFTETGYEKIDKIQNVPSAMEKPWTEAVRISSAAPVPAFADAFVSGHLSSFSAYALVNRGGILAFDNKVISYFRDESIFTNNTADSLVFSNSIPVFYLYRSTFFNEHLDEPSFIQKSRPFLVEFDPSARIFYPLVSYENLNLSETDQVTGFVWNGEKWACSVKNTQGDRVDFTYFIWEPMISITDLSPALSSDTFVFTPSTEAEYRALNSPLLFSAAPAPLKSLLSSLPAELSFYVSWRDDSGVSPAFYFNQGDDSSPLNAIACLFSKADYVMALFADGTSYLKRISTGDMIAFRLPLLPRGFRYGDFTISKNTLYVAWEERNFFKTRRSGFLQVDLEGLLGSVPKEE